MGSAAAGRGLALLRLDRVADALSRGDRLLAGGVADRTDQAGLGAVCLPGRFEGRRMTAPAAPPAALVRCPWPKDDALYLAYHDEEWGVPEYDDRALYEKLMLDGFQAGLSWITILRKRENFRRAFDGFEPEKIARYTPKKIERLMQDAGIVRNRAKIEGTVLSARAWLEAMEKGPRLLEAAVGFRRRQAESEPLPHHAAGSGGNRDITRDVEGTGAARLQVLRTDDRLRLHAGGRHGQRPSGHLPPARSGAEALRHVRRLTRSPPAAAQG